MCTLQATICQAMPICHPEGVRTGKAKRSGCAEMRGAQERENGWIVAVSACAVKRQIGIFIIDASFSVLETHGWEQPQ